MTTLSPTITSEQINNLPLLLGIVADLGIRDRIDTHVVPHGHWQGISIGTLVTIWLCHMLQQRSHALAPVRAWAHDRAQTLNDLLGIALRATDCSDDRLAIVLTKLADPGTQAALDADLTQHWLRLYHLPCQTVRLDTTTVSGYHDPLDATTLFQLGHSKDHRPDLAQFKLMLATLDPLGLPLASQVVAGNGADDPLYIPAYHAAVAACGHRDVLVVGDSKMAALATRGTMVAAGSRYLCAYRPPSATGELTTWIDAALAHPERLETVYDECRAGHPVVRARIAVHERELHWQAPTTEHAVHWRERVLVRQSVAYQQGMQRRLEHRLTRVCAHVDKLRVAPSRGRTRYPTQAALQLVVDTRVAEAELTGIVETELVAVTTTAGTPGWVVASVWVNWPAWQARVAQLGWQVYVTNTDAAELGVAQIEALYGGQAIHERSFSRLKSRNLQIRPVYLRNEQRIAGLVWLLVLALRVLVVVEQRVRQALAARTEAVVGLNPASPTHATPTPTSERMFKAFDNLTRTRVALDGTVYWHVPALTQTQAHILDLLGLPPDLYARLGTGAPKSLLHLRE